LLQSFDSFEKQFEILYGSNLDFIEIYFFFGRTLEWTVEVGEFVKEKGRGNVLDFFIIGISEKML
jgi:hypothetical protein